MIFIRTTTRERRVKHPLSACCVLYKNPPFPAIRFCKTVRFPIPVMHLVWCTSTAINMEGFWDIYVFSSFSHSGRLWVVLSLQIRVYMDNLIWFQIMIYKTSANYCFLVQMKQQNMVLPYSIWSEEKESYGGVYVYTWVILKLVHVLPTSGLAFCL